MAVNDDSNNPTRMALWPESIIRRGLVFYLKANGTTLQSIGTGVAPNAIDSVIGVSKAYCTRVGEGPFPTELFDSAGDKIRARGNEFGAVTGRPRRCGWLDLPLLRYSGTINGTSWLVVTKLDVLDELEEIPVCVSYRINGKQSEEIPAEASGWDKIECDYKKMPGWRTSTR